LPLAATAVRHVTEGMNDLIKFIKKELGRDQTSTQQQDDINFQKMTMSEKFQSGLARGLEKAVGVVSKSGQGFLQGQRVGNETSYLESQGRGGAAGGGGGGGGGGRGTSGLKLKSAEAVAGGDSSEGLINLAYALQEKLGGDLKYFSGLNDTGRDKNSKHKSGQALDLVLNDPEKYPGVLGLVKSMPGVKFAQFEQAGQRNANGSVATGSHIHAEVSAANGAILSGPTSGYKPNLTMHGTEAIVPLNTPAGAGAIGSGDSMNAGLLSAQLSKLEELVTAMKRQNDISSKILAYQS